MIGSNICCEHNKLPVPKPIARNLRYTLLNMSMMHFFGKYLFEKQDRPSWVVNSVFYSFGSNIYECKQITDFY